VGRAHGGAHASFGRRLGAGAGPLAELGREIEALAGDPVALAAFLRDLPGLGELARKLRSVPEAQAELGAPEALLDGARELLLGRLSEVAEG
jgi:hypothetical protein